MEVTTSSPFRSPSAKTFRGDNPNGWPRTPSRVSVASSGVSSCPSLEFTRQSPISMFRHSDSQRPGSSRTTSTTTTSDDRPSPPPPVPLHRSNFGNTTPLYSGSPSPQPPAHAAGTVVQKGLNLSKPMYAHAAESIDPWNTDLPVPDDFDLYDQIDDLMRTYQDLSPLTDEEEETEREEHSTALIVSQKGTLLDRLKSTQEYALSQEIIDHIANSDQDDATSKGSISPIKHHYAESKPRLQQPISYIPAPVFNSHFSNESVDNILYASEYIAEIEKKGLDTILEYNRNSSSSEVQEYPASWPANSITRFSDPSPCRGPIETSIEERLSYISLPDSSSKEDLSEGCPTPKYKKAWRTLSKRSPPSNTYPSNQRKREDPVTPTGASDTNKQQLTLWNPSADITITKEGYLCQAFTNLGDSLARWVSKYAHGPRTVSWSDMPKETKAMFKRLHLVVPHDEAARRFHRSTDSRCILLRQMLANFLFDAIFEPILFGLSLRRVGPVTKQAQELGLTSRTNSVRFKDWESRMVDDETTPEEFKTSLNRAIPHLRRYINFQLAPLLPMNISPTAKLKDSPYNQTSLDRESDLHDIIARAVLLNIEIKKRNEYYEYNFLPEHRTLVNNWMVAEGTLYDPIGSGGTSIPTTNMECTKVHAVVWPCLMAKAPDENFGRMLVKARVVVEPSM